MVKHTYPDTTVYTNAKLLSLRAPKIFREKMSKNPDNLTPKLVGLLEKDPGETVKQLAEQLSVNRTFLAGYLKALEKTKDTLGQRRSALLKFTLRDMGKSDENEKYGFFKAK